MTRFTATCRTRRQANYGRDIKLLQDAGVNTITGCDADKCY
jgi:hypothetical protein